MKVFMINSGYTGCSYARIMLPAIHNGFITDKKSVNALGSKPNPEEIKKGLEWADIVVFHRPEKQEYHNLAKLLKADGKKIVVDNDDTFRIDSYHPLMTFTDEKVNTEIAKRDSNIKEFMADIADLVTCSTETLANEYRSFNKNTIVLPNCVDPDDWDMPLRNTGEKTRIGLVGSVSFEFDYLHITNLIRELNLDNSIQLVLFGLGDAEHRRKNPEVTKKFGEEYAFWDTISNLEWYPWCHIKDYPKRLNEARLDFMLIPRKDNYFNRCKSNIKFLEASMCEVPVIAQSFDGAPYEEITSDNGILIKDNSKWLEEIKKLKENKELRVSMGKNAKEYVLKNYNINNNYHKWANAYKTIL